MNRHTPRSREGGSRMKFGGGAQGPLASCLLLLLAGGDAGCRMRRYRMQGTSDERMDADRWTGEWLRHAQSREARQCQAPVGAEEIRVHSRVFAVELCLCCNPNPMTDAEDSELRRLCDQLRLMAQSSSDEAQHEALRKGALALHLVFNGGLRPKLEDQYDSLGLPLTEPQRQHLASLGLDPWPARSFTS